MENSLFSSKVLDIHALECFFALAETKNFNKAGLLINKSQSAVSQQISKLENILGCTLINRDKRNSLTNNGEYLYGYAYKILKLHQEAVTHFSNPELSGEINFGQRPFKYGPPVLDPINNSDYPAIGNQQSFAISSQSIPDSGTTRGDSFFDTILWTGNSSTRNLTGLNFQPDLVWIKDRDAAYNYVLQDSVRGAGSTTKLSSNLTAGQGAGDNELTWSGYVSSFNYNGFAVDKSGSGAIDWANVNKSSDKYVAWCWKAGGNKNTFNIDDVGYATSAAAGLDAGSMTVTGASVGTKQGFAVAALDAFYKKPITSTEKARFPDALNYANELRKILIKDERFDKEKFFYTGFSYGAQQVLKTIGAPYNNKNPNAWKAIASAEPGCNLFHKPIKLSFPVLIIKGEESHYYIEPCKILEKELLKAGNKVKLVNIPKVNHFFSTNGKIIKGVAVNGCRYDPIIKMPDGKSFLYSGAEISRKEARKRCFTNEAGKGKNRKKLNEAVNLTINFFKDNLN
mgnify:CR=1 FL=1